MENKQLDEEFTLDKEVYRSFPANLSVAQPTTFEPGFDQEETFRSMPLDLQGSTVFEADGGQFGMPPPLVAPKLGGMSMGGFDSFEAFDKDFGGATLEDPRSFQSFNKDIDIRSAPLDKTPITPLPLPQPPFYLERASHFHSKSSIDALVSVMEDTLRNHHVDFRFKPSKCKWRCKAYANCCSIDLRAQIFSLSSGRFAVEIQRREGNLVEFRNLYSKLYAELVQEGHVCCEKGVLVTDLPEPRSVARCRPMIPALSASFEEDVPCESEGESVLLPLVDMMNTQFVDVQLEAVRSAARLSMNDSNLELFRHTEGSVPVLVGLCGSKDSNVRRCALTALSELTRCPKLCATVMAAGGLEALRVAACPAQGALPCPDLTTVEVMRNSVAALANLANSSYKPLVQEACAAQLHQHTSSSDPVLRSHANRAAALLAPAQSVGTVN